MLAGLWLNAWASPMIPVNFSIVTVQATQPLAAEPGNIPAVFTFSRVGNTNAALDVAFNIGGTATNGVDYALITNTINFAAGQTSTNVVITPVNEPTATHYKTVVLSLPRPIFMHPMAAPNFIVGSLNRAVAYIAYNYTNVPPDVSIVTPTNGSSFLSMPNIEIAANAYDSNGWVTSVEFLANAKSLGVVSNNPVVPFQPLIIRESRGSIMPIIPGRHVGRYSFVWTNVPPGNYSLTAIATDNAGLQTTSAAVDITVTTNLPTPKVRIVSPSDGAVLPDRAGINIYAAAAETGGVVDTVEFLANGTNLGVATNYLATEPSGPFQVRLQWLPYFFRWTNAIPGGNVLTAIATDNNGIEATSAPVSITISTNVFHHRGW
jgi:hypothetical protein